MTKEFIPIEQKYSNDCAIAALAMLVDLPYSDVRKTILETQSPKKPFDGVTFSHAKRGMALYGLRLRRVDLEYCVDKYLQLMNHPGVLMVPGRNTAYPNEWHAVYWDGRHVYDPSPTKKYGKNGKTAIKLATDVWQLTS